MMNGVEKNKEKKTMNLQTNHENAIYSCREEIRYGSR